MGTRFKHGNPVSRSIQHIPELVPNAIEINSRFKKSGASVLQHQKIESRRAKNKRLSWPVLLFLIGLVVPWVIFIGPLRLSVYRFVLLVMVLPCLGMLMAGKAGRTRTADIALLLFCIWCTFGLVLNHGFESSVETSGIIFVETFGPYLLARCYIRDADDFYNVIQLLFRIVVLLLPFAIFEFVSGQNILHELFAAVFPVSSAPCRRDWGWRGYSRFLIIQFCSGCVPAVSLPWFTWSSATKTASFSVLSGPGSSEQCRSCHCPPGL